VRAEWRQSSESREAKGARPGLTGSELRAGKERGAPPTGTIIANRLDRRCLASTPLPSPPPCVTCGLSLDAVAPPAVLPLYAELPITAWTAVKRGSRGGQEGGQESREGHEGGQGVSGAMVSGAMGATDQSARPTLTRDMQAIRKSS
jgi:hypothetical protein